MLRALGPEELPASVAYQVPWRVDRSREPTLTLWNTGEEPVHGVRLSLHGDGSVLFASNSLVAPGDHATFRASGCLTPASIVTLRWFRPDETEYLWRIAL
ncbi:MAG TPA: hypothetical protein PLA13_04635 [Microbacteriaceae bacterium]|jgi:hypothetical protein|nr:hypothetical protein [Microbacteriaceae bacterium]HQX35625.1 hypothetical protein [Microbacteriaceae bacterium]HQZ47573.1 hypothetical protein [Microbacteriaceae bacterium]HRA07912.1 hypothetical protein [Microbacteriaceae bacterium]